MKDSNREAFEAIPRNARVLRGAKFKDGEYVALSLFDESSKELAAQLNYGWEVWQAAKAHEAEKLKGWVVVPLNNTTIVAIERMVEQQVEASGITDDVFRLDGEKILNAAVEAQELSKAQAVPDGFVLVERSKLLQILGSAVAINTNPKTKINLLESDFIIGELKAMIEAQEQKK